MKAWADEYAKRFSKMGGFGYYPFDINSFDRMTYLR